MKHLKLGCLACLVVPVVLVGGFCEKVAWDAKMYDLPGPILKSNAPATQKLVTASEVAELLDAYVQPRFEILRDKDFGVSRIATTYLKHAGFAQLKVDTHAEKALIANVNSANRDYAICMLHCAPKPGYEEYYKGKQLQILYFNQEKLIADEYYSRRRVC